MEASTGIEPVYTDLQSAASPLRQLASAVGRLNDLYLKYNRDCARLSDFEIDRTLFGAPIGLGKKERADTPFRAYI